MKSLLTKREFFKKVEEKTIEDSDLECVKENSILTVNLSGCLKITDNGISYLKNCNTLTLDYLKNISVSGFKNLQNIYCLSLAYCSQLTDDDLKYLSNISYLSIIYCTKITDKGLKNLKSCIQVNISGCVQVTDEGIESISFVKNLSCNYFSKLTIEATTFMKDMTFVDLSYSRINDKWLDNLSDVQALYLNGCKITDQGLKKLKSTKILSVLDANITDEGLKNSSKYINNLNINGCLEINGSCFECMPNLQILQAQNTFITSQSLEPLLPILITLNISNCSFVFIDENMAKKFKILKNLTLNKTQVSEQTINSYFQNVAITFV